MSAVAALLPDGRLHLQHGPIDCLCRAWGEEAEVRAGYAQAARCFAGVLDSLCAELPLLRSALPAPLPDGAIARAMHAACVPFADEFITPMAAVAGAVADAVLAAMVDGRAVTRAFVNNGGDIAFFLTPGTSLRCGLVADLASVVPRPNAAGCYRVPPSLDGTFLLTAGHQARGLATSGRACKGRGGRSFSFGIADSVSVLARTAAQADAAATIIGNAVDLPGHPAIERRPAAEIDPASDLGDRLVTFDIGTLTEDAVDAALDAGEAVANRLLRNGLIEGAVLALGGRLRIRHASRALPGFASPSRLPTASVPPRHVLPRLVPPTLVPLESA
jgi:ApbE superfamily uncharacterized protein (UPF0280 family)